MAKDRPPKPPAGLADRFPLRWQELPLSRGVIGLFVLKDPDALLDALTQEEFDKNDARMPYWATVWPAALALADVIATGPRLDGKRVLDLGCGLGPVGLSALERGAQVTFLDWEADAVALACASASALDGASFDGISADWRSPPPMPRFDLVCAADVLYEARNGPAVAAFLAAHLSDGGEAWVADPDRLHAREFPADLPGSGLSLRATETLPPRDGATRLTLWRIGRA